MKVIMVAGGTGGHIYPAIAIINKIKEGKGDFGYNARTDEYVNMYEAGVIDPTKVVRVALENAASVAGMFLTTECGIVDIPEPAPAAPAMPEGGMMQDES